MVNEPSRFELLRFDCICYNQTSGSSKFLDNMLQPDVSKSTTILHSQYLVYNNSEDRAFPLDIFIDVHEQRNLEQFACRVNPHVCLCLFVLRFYGPVNPTGSCRARSVYLTTPLLGRLSPLSGSPVLCTFFRQKLTTALLESAEGRDYLTMQRHLHLRQRPDRLRIVMQSERGLYFMFMHIHVPGLRRLS